MSKDFNKQVFESFPDSVWNGEMPDLENRSGRSKAISLIAKRLTYIAAGLCLPFAAATILLSINKTKDVPVAEPLAQAEIVYTVNNATKGDIVLPDSTLVTLNSGSTLRLAQDFGTGTRTVKLDGEAFFNVHKDKSVPFIINTPQGVDVKVTGTKFNMSCYSGDEFDLTLIQGSVEVTTPKKEVLLIEPSEQVVIKDGFFNVSKDENPEESLDWTEGILRFDHTPIKEVLAQIERWYGVKVEVADASVYRGSFSAEFHSETLNEVLQLLCISSRLSYTVDGSTVNLKSR